LVLFDMDSKHGVAFCLLSKSPPNRVFDISSFYTLSGRPFLNTQY
jgi:hypothetical protein